MAGKDLLEVCASLVPPQVLGVSEEGLRAGFSPGSELGAHRALGQHPDQGWSVWDACTCQEAPGDVERKGRLWGGGWEPRSQNTV